MSDPMVYQNAIQGLPLEDPNLFTDWTLIYYPVFEIYILKPNSDITTTATTSLTIDPAKVLSVTKYIERYGIFTEILIQRALKTHYQVTEISPGW